MASLVAQLVKNLHAMQEIQLIPGWGSSPGEGKGFSILGWRIPWTVYSMGSQRVRQDWVTHFSFPFIECSSLCCTVGPCCLSVLHTGVHVFYPKLVSSIQMSSRIFFFPTKKAITGGHLRAVTAPRCYCTNACEKQVLVSTRLSWRIIGPLAQLSPPLPKPARHHCVPAQFWIALTPMKGKVANRYERTGLYKGEAV